MDWLSWLLQWLAGITQFVIGIVLGTVITGAFTWKIVVPKVMENKDVKELIKEVTATKEALENFFDSKDWLETVKLFREGKELLKKVLENQEDNKRLKK